MPSRARIFCVLSGPTLVGHRGKVVVLPKHYVCGWSGPSLIVSPDSADALWWASLDEAARAIKDFRDAKLFTAEEVPS